jgi:DNA-binding transcriptional LysR family regulator
MNFHAIQAFIAIVETRSLSKAAEALYLSQSTVSHHLKMLEDELNTTLIVRKKGNRTIYLTPKGEEFVSIAERWLTLWKDTCILQNSNPHTSLSIGCTDSINTYVFPDLYKHFLNQEPLIDIHVRTHHSLEIYNLLLNHEIDIGFVVTPFAYKNIIIEPVFNEKMVLICEPNEDSPLKAVHPSELDGKNEIFVDWSPEFRTWHDFWFSSTKRPRANFNNPSLILTLMNNSNYWSIIPISMANSFKKIKNIQIIDLLEPPPNRICYKITHKHPIPSRVDSINILNEHLEIFKDNTDLFV